MRGHSDVMADVLGGSHTAVSRVDIIRDGQVVGQLDVHAGQVVTDGTAAQRTQIELEVADPDGTLTPADMNSLLAPFGTRIQVYRGVRIDDVDLRRRLHDTAVSWATSTEFGVNNGTVGDPTDGSLRMGPV